MADAADTARERVTVNLTTSATQALSELVRITEDSKTEAINKALVAYAMLRRVQHSGGALYVRENGGELERVRLL